ETVIAKVQPSEASGLAAGDAVGLRLSPGRTLVFAEDGSRLAGGDAELAGDAGLAGDAVTERERAHG
ncbi:glycerol-3-phosphate ABC transporter ATP-binding protein, partial [Rhizobium phaseoli]